MTGVQTCALPILSDRARLPSLTELHVFTGSFKEALKSAPPADVNIMGITKDPPFQFMREATELTKSSCVFVNDSGTESALA